MLARQKHKSALEGSCSDVIDHDVEFQATQLPLGAMKG